MVDPLSNPREAALQATLVRLREATFWKARLPEPLPSSFDDLAALPLLHPGDLKNNPHDDFLAVPKEEVWRYHQSFGTTGRASCGWYTVADMEAEVPMVHRWIQDIGPGAVVLNRYPYSFPVPNAVIEAATRLKGGCVVPAGALNFNVSFVRAVNLMRERGVTTVACLPWEPIFLAETARLVGLDPRKDFPELRSWIVAGSLVSPPMKALLEGLWDVPVRILYGSTEVGPMATSCDEGRIHLHDEHFHFEVVEGVLVATTLARQAQPMLRYRTGDAVRFIDDPCLCGSLDRVVELRGRAAGALAGAPEDTLELELQQTILGGLERYKTPVFFCVATGRGLLVRVETREARTGGKEVAQRLSEALGLPVRVALHAPGTLINHVALLSGWHVYKPSYFSDWRDPQARKVLNWSGALINWWGQLNASLLMLAVRKSVADWFLEWKLRLLG